MSDITEMMYSVYEKMATVQPHSTHNTLKRVINRVLQENKIPQAFANIDTKHIGNADKELWKKAGLDIDESTILR